MPAIVSSGQTYNITSGQTDTGDVVLSGGTMLVLSGGEADFTWVGIGGSMKVSSGGLASNTIVSSGGSIVLSGGAAEDTILRGGALTVGAGGTRLGSLLGVVLLALQELVQLQLVEVVELSGQGAAVVHPLADGFLQGAGDVEQGASHRASLVPGPAPDR